MRDARELVRDAWEIFLLYLPLACLGTLALATYWMVRSAPVVATPAVTRVMQHTPDYFLEGFSVKTYDTSGRVRSEVIGDRARHFPDTEWMEIDAIRIRSYDDKGRLTTATARRGLANEDGSQVQLIGNAVVIRDGDPTATGGSGPRFEYHSEFLHAFMTTQKITSNQPVELIHGADHFTANSLDYDNVEQKLLLNGRVRGIITPSPTPAVAAGSKKHPS